MNGESDRERPDAPSNPARHRDNEDLEEINARFSLLRANGGDTASRSFRVSSFHCTLNTNCSFGTASETVVHLNELADWLDGTLFTEAVMVPLIPLDSADPDDLLEIKITNPAVEMGPTTRRVHAHWQLDIFHTNRVQTGRIQRLWQNYARANGPFCRGGYVRMQLLDTRPINYAAKSTGLSPES